MFLITILKYLKNSMIFLSAFCSNNNKNKLFSLHSATFFKILKETKYIWYESTNTQLK